MIFSRLVNCNIYSFILVRFLVEATRLMSSKRDASPIPALEEQGNFLQTFFE